VKYHVHCQPALQEFRIVLVYFASYPLLPSLPGSRYALHSVSLTPHREFPPSLCLSSPPHSAILLVKSSCSCAVTSTCSLDRQPPPQAGNEQVMNQVPGTLHKWHMNCTQLQRHIEF
jgi:hypothetical protein